MAARQLLYTIQKTKVFFYGLNEISMLRSMKHHDHVSTRYFSSKRRSQTEILKSALDNYEDLQLAPLKIKNCNIGVSFSEACLEHEVYSCTGNDIILCESFSNVFKEGFNALHQSIDKVGVGFFDTPNIDNGTEDDMYYYAFSALRQFLTEIGKIWNIYLRPIASSLLYDGSVEKRIRILRFKNYSFTSSTKITFKCFIIALKKLLC